jgi:hypothetical protein
MPLLDHFRPPLFPRRHWESFHVTWAGAMADALNEDLLPEGYFAEEHAHAGAPVEIDVATFADDHPGPAANGTATRTARTYTPPAPPLVVPAAFPDTFEVRVYRAEGGARLVAAVELVSPGNKDRESHRRAFAAKCAGYLAEGVGLLVVDVVTTRQANLHAAVMGLLGQSNTGLPEDVQLYAVAYRPVVRDGADQVEVWPEPLAVGGGLPTLPLSLSAEGCVPIDLEGTYTAARGRRRLP